MNSTIPSLDSDILKKGGLGYLFIHLFKMCIALLLHFKKIQALKYQTCQI